MLHASQSVVEPLPPETEEVYDAARLRAEEPILVLKSDDVFAVFDDDGGIRSGATRDDPVRDAEGLYFCDTRILSRLCVRLAGVTPEIVSAGMDRDNVVFTAELVSPALIDRRGRRVRKGAASIRRRRFLWKKRLYESLTVRNETSEALALDVVCEFEADFRDIFEIRGMARERRGELLAPSYEGTRAVFSYRGLDDVVRTTQVDLTHAPIWDGTTGHIVLDLVPGESETVILSVAGSGTHPEADAGCFLAGMHAAKRRHREQQRRLMRVSSDDARLDAWLERSTSDLALLITERDTGPYPYAGIPWFSTAFGRDALITALQTLWLDPGLARGVLGFLAERQATEASAFRDSEPGKILHETRGGEMAALNEIPFGLYYGGVDSTPLFVLLAGAYLRRTGDLDFVRGLWPNIEAAIGWIDDYGDPDGDGMLEYQRGEETGLANQGWKDSGDSVFHADGRYAQGPIALVEVQGYAHEAKRAAALIASALGDETRADALRSEARALLETIERAFWSDDIGTYALAIDGEEKSCLVRSSNVGHLLYDGCVNHECATRTVDMMTGAAFYSGWGMRTLARGEPHYDPLAYHNGSIWPHDNSLAAAGFARYGRTDAACQVLDGLLDAAEAFGDFRLPELFSGRERGDAAHPEEYPEACAPQAWAAGSALLLLQSALGLSVHAEEKRITLHNPRLPADATYLRIEGLEVGHGAASFTVRQDRGRSVITDVEATGDIVISIAVSDDH